MGAIEEYNQKRQQRRDSAAQVCQKAAEALERYIESEKGQQALQVLRETGERVTLAHLSEGCDHYSHYILDGDGLRYVTDCLMEDKDVTAKEVIEVLTGKHYSGWHPWIDWNSPEELVEQIDARVNEIAEKALADLKKLLMASGFKSMKFTSKEDIVEAVLACRCQIKLGNKTDSYGTKNTVKGYKELEKEESVDADSIPF